MTQQGVTQVMGYNQAPDDGSKRGDNRTQTSMMDSLLSQCPVTRQVYKATITQDKTDWDRERARCSNSRLDTLLILVITIVQLLN